MQRTVVPVEQPRERELVAGAERVDEGVVVGVVRPHRAVTVTRTCQVRRGSAVTKPSLRGLVRMQDLSFTSLTVVLGITFLVPLALGCVPRLRIPAVVVEIVLGVVVGPQVLDWARVDDPVGILSVIGLGFLLFLCGLEVDVDLLRGRILSLTAASFAISLVLAIGVGLLLDAAGLVRSPLLAGVILTATSLGLVLPTLQHADRQRSQFAQLVFAGATLGNLVSALLLSLLFSRDTNDLGTRVVLLAGFVVTVAVVVLALSRHRMSMPLSKVLVRLQDTTARSACGARCSCCCCSCSPRRSSGSLRSSARSWPARS